MTRPAVTLEALLEHAGGGGGLVEQPLRGRVDVAVQDLQLADDLQGVALGLAAGHARPRREHVGPEQRRDRVRDSPGTAGCSSRATRTRVLEDARGVRIEVQRPRRRRFGTRSETTRRSRGARPLGGPRLAAGPPRPRGRARPRAPGPARTDLADAPATAAIRESAPRPCRRRSSAAGRTALARIRDGSTSRGSSSRASRDCPPGHRTAPLEPD